MPHIIRDDGARLTYEVRPAAHAGSASPFVFQHGMGGQRSQPLGYLAEPLADTDVICMDARGHGDSSDIVDPDRCSFDVYADDVIALADHLCAERIVMGGISLGAAVAINIAIRHPHRVAALVLCRPAWLNTAQADRNRCAYSQIADLLDVKDVDQALAEFTATTLYAEIEAESASAAQSLRHQITRPRAALNAEVLRRFPASTPATQLDGWTTTAVPTLVIGHHDDPFHPWGIAQATAEMIPHAALAEVTSKDRDPAQFTNEVDYAISQFIGALR